MCVLDNEQCEVKSEAFSGSAIDSEHVYAGESK